MQFTHNSEYDSEDIKLSTLKKGEVRISFSPGVVVRARSTCQHYAIDYNIDISFMIKVASYRSNLVSVSYESLLPIFKYYIYYNCNKYWRIWTAFPVLKPLVSIIIIFIFFFNSIFTAHLYLRLNFFFQFCRKFKATKQEILTA